MRILRHHWAILLGIQFLVAPLYAAGGFSLAPAVLELKGKPGQGTQQRLTITNGTPDPVTFDLAVLDVITRGGKRVFVPAGELQGSIAATAVLAPKRLLVPAGQTGSAEITLTLPPDTSVRAIVARFQAVDPLAAPGRVGVTVGLGCLLTFNITDSVAASPDPLIVQPQTATTSLAFSQWITNSGKEPFIAKGVIAILDASQRLVTKLVVPRTRFLPGERLELKAEEPAELPAGRYRAVLTLTYEGRVLTRTADWVSR
jgi:hypothetical protein